MYLTIIDKFNVYESCLVKCKDQTTLDPMNRKHKAHTNNDKADMPIIVGTMCYSPRVHYQPMSQVLYYILQSLPYEKFLKYTIHMLKKIDLILNAWCISTKN